MRNKKILQVFIGILLFASLGFKQKKVINDKINFIYADSVNNIWVGASGGFYRIKSAEYDNAKNIKKSAEIKGAAEDSKKNIYFGIGKTIVYYNTEKENEEKIIEPVGMGRQDSSIECLAIDGKDNLWIGRNNDMLVMYNGKSFKTFPVWDVASIDFSSSGDTWVGAKSGIYCIKNGALEEFNQDNSDLPDNIINDIIIDDYDNIWIATNFGLVKYNRHIWIIYNTENSELKNNQVTSVYLDKNGSLIIGMHSGDLQIIKNNKWQGLDLGLKKQTINTVFRDSKDVFLLGTDSGLVISK
ncbi:MAG: two-component regulator propeller domain-containing protein [bacterium]